jgi:hypothetical protein
VYARHRVGQRESDEAAAEGGAQEVATERQKGRARGGRIQVSILRISVSAKNFSDEEFSSLI